MDKQESVDQSRLTRVKALIDGAKRLFIRQGSVVATWRTVVSQSDGQTRRLGPYWSLRYRESGRQKSFYIGRSAELAAAVRQLLEQMQKPRRQFLFMGRVRDAAMAAQRAHKKIWEQDLRRDLGAYLKGYELRGLKKALRLQRSRAAALLGVTLRLE